MDRAFSILAHCFYKCCNPEFTDFWNLFGEKSKFYRLLRSCVQPEFTPMCTQARQALKGCRSVHSKELKCFGRWFNPCSLFTELHCKAWSLSPVFFFFFFSSLLDYGFVSLTEWWWVNYDCVVMCCTQSKFYHHSLIKHWLNWWLCVCAYNYVCVLSFK